MTHANTATLNNQFGLDNRLQFGDGLAGLVRVDLCHNEAKLELYLQGAHVTSYQPSAKHDVLWMSESAVYAPGKSLRGGIPLCWPWFGPHPDNSSRPQHGYARTADFSVLSTSADAASTTIILALDPATAPFAEWQNRARLEVEIRLSDSLWMEIRTVNCSDSTLTVSNALHSYFSIAGLHGVTLPALTGLSYLDKPQRYKQLEQTEALEISGEVDRVYLAPPAEIELLDATRQSTTSISSWGNNNLVVWNPGAAIAKTMADLDDQGFEQMLCIEPANALEQAVRLKPGECHRLGQEIKGTLSL